MKLNQKGAIDMMFVVLLVVVVGVGYFVYTQVVATDDVVNDSGVASEAGSSSKLSDGNDGKNNSDGDAETKAVAHESWELFTDPTDTYSMRIPDGWSIVASEGSNGFYSTGYQSDAAAPAKIVINSGGGRGGPFLINVNYSDELIDLASMGAGGEDTSWQNSLGLDAVRAVDEIDETGIDGAAGDTRYTYLLDLNDRTFMLTYTMSPGDIDSTSDIELALSSLELVNKL